MSDDSKEGANEGPQRLTRRASDKPHAFQQNKGFRTCRACGLPKNHEIHSAKSPPKPALTRDPQPQSMEQLREQLRADPPRPTSRVATSRIALISGMLIVVVVGLMFLALFRFNNTVDKPLQELLKDPSNQLIKASAHFDGLNSNIVVFDLTKTSSRASRLDVFRLLLQYAEAMEKRRFTKVILAYLGAEKFSLEGGYFQQLGQEYKRDNLVYIIRTFPSHLTPMDGTKPFSQYTGGLLQNVTKEVEQFKEFGDEWYRRDVVVDRNEVGSSTAAAAEPVDPSSNDNWLVLDSKNEADNTAEVSLHDPGTDGAVLIIRCANREPEAYVDTDSALQNESVRVRFDDSASVREHWYRSASDEALFAPNAIAFARRLDNTHTFRFEFTPFKGRERSIVFDVSGLDSKLQRMSDSCDWVSIDNNYAKAKGTPATPK